MQQLARVLRQRMLIVATCAALGALALLWQVRATPIQPIPLARVDALSAFFIFTTFAGMALTLLARPNALRPAWRALVAVAVLVVAYSSTLTPVIAGAYVLLAVVRLPGRGRGGHDERGRLRLRALRDSLRRALLAMAPLFAAMSLLVGYVTLAARGALHYDDRTAGTALDSFVFWFVLLAAVSACSTLFDHGTEHQRPATGQGAIPATDHWFVVDASFQIAWLYPLARLYSLGPWNNGWAFATVLLGGATAFWAASGALTRAQPELRGRLLCISYLGLALAGFGLATGAGIAAGCYGLLTYLVLSIPSNASSQLDTELASSPDDQQQETVLPRSSFAWLLSGAVPLTAPFVATWMLIGAGTASGLTLLSGLAWTVALLNALTVVLTIMPVRPRWHRSVIVPATASVTIGAGAPLIMRALIDPVVQQLQGGLTPFGDIDIWPWIGLATNDSARRPVTSLPSIVVLMLMLVLAALVYLVARLYSSPAAQESSASRWVNGADEDVTPLRRLSALINDVRAEVPWLGASEPGPHKEHGVDGK